MDHSAGGTQSDSGATRSTYASSRLRTLSTRPMSDVWHFATRALLHFVKSCRTLTSSLLRPSYGSNSGSSVIDSYQGDITAGDLDVSRWLALPGRAVNSNRSDLPPRPFAIGSFVLVRLYPPPLLPPFALVRPWDD